MRTFNSLVTLSLSAALIASSAAERALMTGHEAYGSSVGVLGCKIDINRVAHFPSPVSCNNICVRVSFRGRSFNLLRIDQSGGAFDISQDAWNLLVQGEAAPRSAVEMEYQDVDPSECASLINTPGNRLPLSAWSSGNYLSGCFADRNSWVARNWLVYNFLDVSCTQGHDEVCTLYTFDGWIPYCPRSPYPEGSTES
jgi:hypothetical protein